MVTITKKRLMELEANINQTMGWNAKATERERKEINKRWDKMAGNTSFHDAVRKMIMESK